MANLKVGNATIGKIAVIEPPEVPIVENDSGQDSWVRPSHWLDMPVIGSGEHKAAFLYGSWAYHIVYYLDTSRGFCEDDLR